MQTAQGNMLESLLNVKSFLELHADALAEVVKTGSRDALLEAIDELQRYGNQQTAGAGASKNATKLYEAARRTLLRDHMSVVSRIARVKLAGTPELATLKMPRSHPSAVKLAEAAYEMANSAEKNAAVFVGAGLPADFVARLKGAADALIATRQQRSMSRVSRATATQGLNSSLSAGRKIVLVLDAMVKTALKSEPALLVGWTQAKRVSKVTGQPVNGGSVIGAAPAPSAPETTKAA